MKTIKQLADICGVSKTSINRAIDELQIEKTLSGNKNLISDTDADRIVSLLRGFGKTCSDFNPNQSKTDTETQQTETTGFSSSSSAFSVSEKNTSELIQFLYKQIEIKDKQIEDLNETNKMLIQSNAYTLKQLEELKRLPDKSNQEESAIHVDSEETPNDREQNQKKSGFISKIKSIFS